MFYPCPSCKKGAIQDWRPESVIVLAGRCAVCGAESKTHRGCDSCGKPHCLGCVLEFAASMTGPQDTRR